jgi:hypothetical protein
METISYPFPEFLPKEHGKFPYLILRPMSAFYIQIPILIETCFESKTSLVYTMKKDVIRIAIPVNFDNEQIRHHAMLDVLKNYKPEVKRRCLVLSPQKAIYIANNSITESEFIPAGGVLLDGQMRNISDQTRHYLKSESL